MKDKPDLSMSNKRPKVSVDANQHRVQFTSQVQVVCHAGFNYFKNFVY